MLAASASRTSSRRRASSGVSIVPGAMVLTRMSLLARSRAATSVIPTTLVLDREQRVAAVFLKELLAADLQPVVERIAGE